MKQIPLTKNQFTRVDDGDFNDLSARQWCATWTSGGFYAMRMTEGSHATRQRIFMHRHILGLPIVFDGRVADHINGDTLDNQRGNLRIATARENLLNQRARMGTITGIKGVGYDRQRDRLEVKITLPNGKHLRIARFLPSQLEEAKQCYRDAAMRYYGEFARFE
jgi:hypothetical protein